MDLLNHHYHLQNSRTHCTDLFEEVHNRVQFDCSEFGKVDFLNGLKENVILGHRLTIGNNTPLRQIPYQTYQVKKKLVNTDPGSSEIQQGIKTSQLSTRIKLLLLTKL